MNPVETTSVSGMPGMNFWENENKQREGRNLLKRAKRNYNLEKIPMPDEDTFLGGEPVISDMFCTILPLIDNQTAFSPTQCKFSSLGIRNNSALHSQPWPLSQPQPDVIWNTCCQESSPIPEVLSFQSISLYSSITISIQYNFSSCELQYLNNTSKD